MPKDPERDIKFSHLIVDMMRKLETLDDTGYAIFEEITTRRRRELKDLPVKEVINMYFRYVDLHTKATEVFSEFLQKLPKDFEFIWLHVLKDLTSLPDEVRNPILNQIRTLAHAQKTKKQSS